MAFDNHHIDLEKLSPGDPLVQITYGGWGGDNISIRVLKVVKVLKTQLVLQYENIDRELRVIIRDGRLTNDEHGRSRGWSRESVNLHLPNDPAIDAARERMRRVRARSQVRKQAEIVQRDPSRYEDVLKLQQVLGEWIDILKAERKEEDDA